MFIGLARNGAQNPAPTYVRPNLAAALGVVTDETVRAAFGPPSAPTLHSAAGHQLGEDRGFMTLAWRQQQRQEPPSAFGPPVDFRAEAALAAPECFGCRVPFVAPAAC
jgi:hypothetical protein